MRQHSLFPDDYEVIEQALAALRRLDVDEALAKVRLARARDTRLADLVALEGALVWLARQTLHDQADIARTLLAVGEAFAARELGEVAAGVVDDAIAHVFAADTGDSPFLDPANRVPRALLDLLRRRHSKAHGRLRELVLAWPDRGDLWCWYGNACLGAERQAEARAAWVRALLLAPDRFDWWRIADRQLRTVRDDCLADAPAGDGGLTLAVAWRRGVASACCCTSIARSAAPPTSIGGWRWPNWHPPSSSSSWRRAGSANRAAAPAVEAEVQPIGTASSSSRQ